MPGDSIRLFMWGYQRHFRTSVAWGLKESLKVLGVSVDPTVFLIGLLNEDGVDEDSFGHPLCVEPEDGPIVPADFDGLHHRATDLYNQDPDSQVSFSYALLHEKKHQEFRQRAVGAAISEVLEAKLGPGLRFFVGLPTLVDAHFVYVAVGLPESVLDKTPHLTTPTVDRLPVTRSLIWGAIDQILLLSRRALHEPDASKYGIGTDPADVAREAGRNLTLCATMLAGGLGWGLFDGLTRVATTRYERRVGTGSLLIARPGSEHIKRSITLGAPVAISETRTLRKLLETSSHDGEALLTDGVQVYGLGQLQKNYPETAESVFHLLVLGDGVWELRHADIPLATVQYGAPRLPEERVRREQLDDVCDRVFGEYDSEALWALAMSAAEAAHGTMLVISGSAADEAARLASQALTINPTRLDDALVRKFTGIDGALLVDPSGQCHAIGVILDGTATSEGDRSRGARYNSAVKYLASAEGKPTVILLVSEDGMINLLPNLRPQDAPR